MQPRQQATPRAACQQKPQQQKPQQQQAQEPWDLLAATPTGQVAGQQQPARQQQQRQRQPATPQAAQDDDDDDDEPEIVYNAAADGVLDLAFGVAIPDEDAEPGLAEHNPAQPSRLAPSLHNQLMDANQQQTTSDAAAAGASHWLYPHSSPAEQPSMPALQSQVRASQS